MMNKLNMWVVPLSLCCCMLLCLSLYLLGVQYYLQEDLKANIAVAEKITRAASLLTYGLVQSIDAEHHRLTIVSRNAYSGAPSTFVISINAATDIEQQTLQTDDAGTYVALSARVPASFSDIPVGTRVAVSAVAGSDPLTAETITFGNPI